MAALRCVRAAAGVMGYGRDLLASTIFSFAGGCSENPCRQFMKARSFFAGK
jgi:hypothetical protein